MTDASDPRLRFRVWIDAELVHETWIDASDPDCVRFADTVSERHKAITDQADRDGCRWLVEVYDPALPDEEARTQFGTDMGRLRGPLLVCPFCEAKVRTSPGVDDNAVVAAHWAESPSCGRAWAEGAAGLASLARDIETGGEL